MLSSVSFFALYVRGFLFGLISMKEALQRAALLLIKVLAKRVDKINTGGSKYVKSNLGN
jgi:hypothetical protein